MEKNIKLLTEPPLEAVVAKLSRRPHSFFRTESSDSTFFFCRCNSFFSSSSSFSRADESPSPFGTLSERNTTSAIVAAPLPSTLRTKKTKKMNVHNLFIKIQHYTCIIMPYLLLLLIFGRNIRVWLKVQQLQEQHYSVLPLCMVCDD